MSSETTAPSGAALIEAVGISKEFSGVRIPDNVNVALQPGEIFGVIGENGAGKSTFMKILSGIYFPTEGHVVLEGKQMDVKGTTVVKSLPGFAQNTPPEINIFAAELITKDNAVKFYEPESIFQFLYLKLPALPPGAVS